MSEDHVKLTVRLPARLHKALKERAVEYNVSLNQAVVDALNANVTGEPHEETEKEKVIRALREAGKLSDTAALIDVPEGAEPTTLEEVREWLKGVPLSDWIVEDRGPR
jgi:molybdopterin converting factor small subunit